MVCKVTYVGKDNSVSFGEYILVRGTQCKIPEELGKQLEGDSSFEVTYEEEQEVESDEHTEEGDK